jgi:hypothetical protein
MTGRDRLASKAAPVKRNSPSPFSTRCATRRSSGMDGRRPSKSRRDADRQSGGNGQVMNESSPA